VGNVAGGLEIVYTWEGTSCFLKDLASNLDLVVAYHVIILMLLLSLLLVLAYCLSIFRMLCANLFLLDCSPSM
jgi:hypothetical protein